MAADPSFSIAIAESTPLIAHPHVEMLADVLGGSPMITGTRTPVHRLWLWHRKGVTVETLASRYKTLSPASVLDALAFAYDKLRTLELVEKGTTRLGRALAEAI